MSCITYILYIILYKFIQSQFNRCRRHTHLGRCIQGCLAIAATAAQALQHAPSCTTILRDFSIMCLSHKRQVTFTRGSSHTVIKGGLPSSSSKLYVESCRLQDKRQERYNPHAGAPCCGYEPGQEIGEGWKEGGKVTSML